MPSEIKFLLQFSIFIVPDVLRWTKQRKEASSEVKWGYRNQAQRNELSSGTESRPMAGQLLPSRVPAVAFPKSLLKLIPSQLSTVAATSGSLQGCPHRGSIWEVNPWLSPSPWASWKGTRMSEHAEIAWLCLGQSALNASQPVPDQAFQRGCSSSPWEYFQPNIWKKGEKEPAGRCLILYTRRECLYPDNPSCTTCVSNH